MPRSHAQLARLGWCAVVACCPTVGCTTSEAAFLYGWDDRRVVCSEPVDNLTGPEPRERVEELFQMAANRDEVATIHMHSPDETITTSWIEDMLDLAHADGLSFVTYAEMRSGPRHAAVALAFDDQAIDAWYELRDRLADHGAHVTFFVTRWGTAWTDDDKAKLRALHALGHDVQPHSTNHVNPRDYVRDHGLDAYIADEVVPSIEAMRNAGYPPSIYAFPFGETSPEITDAVLTHIDRVRVGPGSCPY